jgi:hypothetical protein
LFAHVPGRGIADSKIEELNVRLPFRIRIDRQVEVHLHVELGFESGRLADLVELLAHSRILITDLKPNRFWAARFSSLTAC